MAFEMLPCDKQYFKDARAVGMNFNTIPVIGRVDVQMELYFPRPWLITALVQQNDVVFSSPPYQKANTQVLLPTAQGGALAKDLFVSIPIDCAFATTQPYSLGGVKYFGPGIQSIDYRYYWSKYLSPAWMETPNQIYWDFTNQGSRIYDFWSYISIVFAGDANFDWYSAYINFVHRLFQETDLRLWGAPGIYIIDNENPESLAWQPIATNAEVPVA